MDLRRYAQVLWRFRILVASGLLLALALAIVSVVKVGPNGLTYRDAQLWAANMQLEVKAVDPTSDQLNTPADALTYSQTILTDPVRRLANRDDGIRAKIIATPVRDPASGASLAFIDVAAIATSPKAAMVYAERTGRALNTVITEGQRADHLPRSQRETIETVRHAVGASVYRSRSKTLPIVVFFAVMFATIGLAFILENALPRREDGDMERDQSNTEQRISA